MYINSINNMIQNFLTQLNGVYNDYWTVILLLIFLIIASYTDIKNRIIPNKLNATFFILRILLIPLMGISWSNVIGMLFLFFLFLIPAMIMNCKMGGDIKASIVIGLYLGGYVGIPFMLITVIVCILFFTGRMLIKKPIRTVPMAPFFLVSHLCLWIACLVWG